MKEGQFGGEGDDGRGVCGAGGEGDDGRGVCGAGGEGDDGRGVCGAEDVPVVSVAGAGAAVGGAEEFEEDMRMAFRMVRR